MLGTVVVADAIFPDELFDVPCELVVAHETILCRTIAGPVGRQLRWTITVDSQATECSPPSSVSPPFIVGLEGEGVVNASTLGGERVVLRGTNFGALDNRIDFVRCGMCGVPPRRAAFAATRPPSVRPLASRLDPAATDRPARATMR